MNAQAENQVQVWLAPVTPVYDAAVLVRHEALLNAEERTRWQRFLYPADRQRFLLARAFVRTVLADCLGHGDPAALQFAQTPHGKPELAGPHAKKLHFNLSHTDGLLALTVSRSHVVGVDVEALGRKVELLALSQRYFAMHEHEELQDLDGAAQRERFFALWTLKEAWLKARGLGLRVPLDDFSFSFGGKHPVIEFGPQLDERPQEWQFRLLAREQFRIALAVKYAGTQALQVQLREWQK